MILEDKISKLGNESKYTRHYYVIFSSAILYRVFLFLEYLVYEQVCIAALDCSRIKIAEQCIKHLSDEFPGSARVHKLHAMKLEALERYDEALQVLQTLIQRDSTNGVLHKRKVAILKAKGRISDAISELTEYLKL